MATETYTIVLRSGDGVGTNTISKQYTINWQSFLPKKFKRFMLKICFRVIEDIGNDQDYVCVNLSDMNAFVWDSKKAGKGTIAGCSAQFSGTTNFVYQGLANDIEGVMIEYPTQNQVTVSLTKMDGSSLTTACGTYMLWLQLKPVKDD